MNIDDLRVVLPEFLNNPPVTLNQSREEVQELFDKLCLLIFNDERDRVNHYVLTEEEYKILSDMGFENISDFSGKYDDLIGLPDIPAKVEDLEDGADYATKDYIHAYIGAPIPRKTSDLQNDMGYITAEAIPEIPERVSELDNDMGYITGEKMEELFKGTLSGEKDENGNPIRNQDGIFPTRLSCFTNDVGYARSCDVINYKRLSEMGINFGSENFEDTLIELAKLNPGNPELNIVYRGVCYNSEILQLFVARNTNECFIEVKPIEQLPNKVVYEITVTNLNAQPYRFIRLYEITINKDSYTITNKSPYWHTAVNLLTEDRVKELVLEILKEQGIIK